MGDPRPRQVILNLLLISVDSLRYDFVSRTNQRISTPRFDALSRAFSFSDRCFSVSSATRPVHTSLFTGLYPFEHGVTSQRTPAMRPGIPHLFALFASRGFRIGAFSEAAGIFAGLDYAPWISADDPGRILRFIGTQGAKLLFAHFWGCHTPYGAADGRAMGETARLLKEGRRQQVIQQYQQAVEGVFETRIASLLEQMDLREWMVLICGDHGESWTAEEPYHGQTLDNSVLRVPLYLHLPNTGNPVLGSPLVSLVDVFPTLEAVFNLQSGYRGYGRDLRQVERPGMYLAQIFPTQALAKDRLGADRIRGDSLTLGQGAGGPQWALFDSHRKFTCWEEEGAGRLEHTLSGEKIPYGDAESQYYRAAYAAMGANSGYAQLPEPTQTATSVLDQRLRELGYL